MSKFSTFKKILKNKNAVKIAIFNNLVHSGLTNIIPDKLFLKLSYRIKVGERLNLKNPRTFNEKLQWLKLYDRKPIYKKMVDKYEAKKYVASIIGDEYIIPTLGVWDKFEDIDFDSLPNQFVLKCTHDSASVVICKDKEKFDYNEAKKHIEHCLEKDLFWFGREWPYKGLKRRIIAEKYMEDSTTSELRDYKFFCFGGVAKCYKVDFDRFVEHRANYFSTDGDVLKIGEEAFPPDFDKSITVPMNLDNMKEFAEKLSAVQPFLRADFYDVNGKVYFGEMTFYPASGFGKFIYNGNDELLGSWIELPQNIGGGGYSLIYKDLLCMLNTAVAKSDWNQNVDVKKNRNLDDYKIHSFNEEPKVILVCRDRFSEMGLTEDFFDQEWTHLDMQREHHSHSSEVITRPKELDKMLELARTLSKDMTFLRFDFYTIGEKIYFGELTFFPAGGFEKFVPESFDKELGDWIRLPETVEGGMLLVNGNCYVLVSIRTGSDKRSKESAPLRDYKIYTFNGKAMLCMVIQDRGIHTKADYFDRDYNWLDITWGYDHADFLPNRPQNYELMYQLAEKLAAGIPELRVDFYEVNGRVYFGELTFFDGCGFEKIEPIEWDYKLGSMVCLPKKK